MNCRQCGVEFEPNAKRLYDRDRQVYCDEACGRAFRSAKWYAQKMERREKELPPEE